MPGVRKKDRFTMRCVVAREINGKEKMFLFLKNAIGNTKERHESVTVSKKMEVSGVFGVSN